MRSIHLSLSTIPPRFNDLGTVPRPLLQQSADIASVTVYVPKSYRRFPDHEFCLPNVPDGVSVDVVDTDPGPATKSYRQASDLAAKMGISCFATMIDFMNPIGRLGLSRRENCTQTTAYVIPGYC